MRFFNRDFQVRMSMVAVLAMLLLATPAAAERWFHVHVTDEDNGEPVNVHVNLPLTLIEKVLALIPEDVSAEMEVELNDAGFSIEDLREVWAEVRDAQDATFVTVEGIDENVVVRKSGNYILANVEERSGHGTQVDVRFPFSVVDALFSSSDDRLDVQAAVRALAEHGDGDIVSVVDGATRVRVWVDDYNEPSVQ